MNERAGPPSKRAGFFVQSFAWSLKEFLIRPSQMFASHLSAGRILIAILSSAFVCWAIWQTARIGIARTVSENAMLGNQVGDADRAVRLSPSDAETHYARGEVLLASDDDAQARIEFERAVQLRPRDYYLWLILGV